MTGIGENTLAQPVKPPLRERRACLAKLVKNRLTLTVREWQWVYRAFGSEALLSMGGKQSRYTFEQRVAAASAVVDGGMAKADAMAEFGIRSKSPLERWCRLYREGGAEALRPRPKGRPRGSRSKPRARTREQELEERCRRLEAEVAYLKKLRALVERDGL